MKKVIKISNKQWKKISQNEIVDPEVLNNSNENKKKFFNAYKKMEESLIELKDMKNMAFCVNSFAKTRGGLFSILNDETNWK